MGFFLWNHVSLLERERGAKIFQFHTQKRKIGLYNIYIEIIYNNLNTNDDNKTISFVILNALTWSNVYNYTLQSKRSLVSGWYFFTTWSVCLIPMLSSKLEITYVISILKYNLLMASWWLPPKLNYN